MRSRRKRNTTNKPWWFKKLDSRNCDCNQDKFPVKKSEQRVGYSDSLVKYMKLECPQCGDTFKSTKLLVEG